jgi:hypothetical protein
MPGMMGPAGVVAAQAGAALIVGSAAALLGWLAIGRLATSASARMPGADAPPLASGRAALAAAATRDES